MGLKKDKIKFFLFLAFNIAVFSINDLRFLSLFYFFSLILLKGKITRYVKNFFLLYLFMVIVVLSNMYFSANLDRGLLIALRVLSVSTLGYAYSSQISYYSLATLFYNAKFFRVISIMILAIFMFIKASKKAISSFNISYKIRNKSIILHPVSYLTSFSVYLISYMVGFASDFAQSITNRDIL